VVLPPNTDILAISSRDKPRSLAGYAARQRVSSTGTLAELHLGGGVAEAVS